MSGAISSRRTIGSLASPIDGPQEFHDEYRRTQTNKPSWLKVMNGIKLLKKHGVE